MKNETNKQQGNHPMTASQSNFLWVLGVIPNPKWTMEYAQDIIESIRYGLGTDCFSDVKFMEQYK